MSPESRFRRLPPVCLLVAISLALRRRLRFRHRHVGSVLAMDDGRRFRVFRHMERLETGDDAPSVLVIRFRFARFSQQLNRLLSLLPIPVIGGFPGFRTKLWMVEEGTGFWQGVYEWESPEALDLYRQSFVLGMMNRRAEADSITSTVIPRTRLSEYLEGRFA